MRTREVQFMDEQGRTTRRLAICGALAACALEMASCSARAGQGSAHASPAKVRGVAHLATWVWQKQAVLDPAERTILLAFAVAQGVDLLYVADANEYEDAGFDALADLMRRAALVGIRVHLVGGDPSWARPEHHPSALALIDRVARLNGRLRRASLPEIPGVQYDVEPYALADWHSHPGTIESQYVALLDELRMSAQKAGVELWMTIPFWFSHHPVRDTTLDRAVLDQADGVVVMAYRSTVAGVTRSAEELLMHARERRRPVVVALEIGCAVSQESTLCGVTLPELRGALEASRAELERFDSFGGLAVHAYAAWRSLVQARPAEGAR
jgi:nucleotide-binding universal stress UspA family protein